MTAALLSPALSRSLFSTPSPGTAPTPTPLHQTPLHPTGATPTLLTHLPVSPGQVAVASLLLAALLVVGTRLGAALVAARRQARLSARPALVVIHPPPQVDPAGAAMFWDTLAELLAGALRPRWLFGAAHAVMEYRWSRRRLTIACWVPSPVRAAQVAAAVRAAWPGAGTDIVAARPPLPAPPAPLPAASASEPGSGSGPAARADRRRGRDGSAGPDEPVGPDRTNEPGRGTGSGRADARRAGGGGGAGSGGRVGSGGAVGSVLVPVLPGWYPLRTDHGADPLRPLLHLAGGLGPGAHVCVQVLARPARGRAVARLRRSVVALRTGRPVGGIADPATWLRPVLDLLTPGPSARRGAPSAAGARDPIRDRDARTAVEPAVGPWWEVAVRFAVAETDPRRSDAARTAAAQVAARGIAAAFGVYAARNRYRRLPLRDPVAVLASRRLDRGHLMPAVTLAALAGLPTDPAVPGLDRAGAKAVPAPVAVPGGGRGAKPLGRAVFDGQAVALPVTDARHHVHVLGTTGSGKSTLMTHLILDDVAHGRGVVVIDPKGDLAIDVLDRLPRTAAERLVLIDPDQPGGGARINPLAAPDHDLAVDNVVSIFSTIFAKFWGPRMDDVMRVACLTLMRFPEPVLTHVPPLLNSKQFRAQYVVGLDDPHGLGGFWQWYDTSPAGLRAQVIGPVLARLRSFLLRDFVLATVGSPTTSFSMADVLDGGILIARLPKGQLGEDTARLLGSFVLGSVWQAATARAAVAQDRRRDATCYVDEAHTLLNLSGSVADMLAEARGYRLSLVLAHQDLGQLPRETLAALSANARNKIFFSCSPEDARVLARHTVPELDEHDLAHLDAYTAAARLVIGSRATGAFTLATRAPTSPPPGRSAEVRSIVAARAAGSDGDAGSDPAVGAGRAAGPAGSGRGRR